MHDSFVSFDKTMLNDIVMIITYRVKHYKHHTPVAQWIEQRTSKPKVVGSIPTQGTKIK